jgi:hypothetical protein
VQAQPNDFFLGELHFKSATGKEQTQWVHDVLTHLGILLAHDRSQVAAVASRLGAPPAEMDYLIYRRDMQDALASMRQAEGA